VRARMTLRGRLSLVAGVAVAVAVAGAAIVLYFAVRSELRGQIDDALQTRARIGSEILDRVGMPPAGAPALPPPEFGGAAGYVQLVRPDGTVLRPSEPGPSLPIDPGTLRAATGDGRSSLKDAHVDGVHLRVLTMPVSDGAVQIARPLTEVDRVLHRILLVLVLVSAAGVAAALALGAGVARAALAPVAAFTRRTEELSGEADLSQRLDVRGDDELARLARSYNATLDALERSAKAQRRLVADASHELRTPLASLRTNFELLGRANGVLPEHEREELLGDVIEQLDELNALVGDIVELALDGDAGEPVDDVRLDELVGAAIGRARRLAPALRFEALLEPCVVRGVPERIQRAVTNLLDNATKWSPPGGTITIRVSAGELCVRDHGPGFAERDLPFVFDRFYRADAARKRPGSGLGLAIVRQVAESHGGWARAENAASGGARLRVGFPAALGAPTEGLS
jgi:two-component system, OmpR family, sensor histidine kinase MprB